MRKVAEEPATPTIENYRNQLWRNVMDRPDTPPASSIPGTTSLDPSDFHMGRFKPVSSNASRSSFEDFLAQRDLSSAMPWNNRQFLASMKQMNRQMNPFSQTDPKFGPTQQYIDARTMENRERMRNGTLIDNEDTKVPLPDELKDTEEGRKLEQQGYGFASNGGTGRASKTASVQRLMQLVRGMRAR